MDCVLCAVHRCAVSPKPAAGLPAAYGHSQTSEALPGADPQASRCGPGKPASVPGLRPLAPVPASGFPAAPRGPCHHHEHHRPAYRSPKPDASGPGSDPALSVQLPAGRDFRMDPGNDKVPCLSLPRALASKLLAFVTGGPMAIPVPAERTADLLCDPGLPRPHFTAAGPAGHRQFASGSHIRKAGQPPAPGASRGSLRHRGNPVLPGSLPERRKGKRPSACILRRFSSDRDRGRPSPSDGAPPAWSYKRTTFFQK